MRSTDNIIVTVSLVIIVGIIGTLFIMDWVQSNPAEESNSTSYAYSLVSYGAAPSDGAIVKATTVNLSWLAGKLATSNSLYFHADRDLVTAGDAQALLAETKETTFTVSDLKTDTTYYWRVDAVNPQEPNSPWTGTVWHFHIPPREAYNLYPPAGATHVRDDVQLTWDLAVDATAHRIAFGTDANTVASDPGETLNAPEASFDPNRLTAGVTYYWRVDAVSPNTVTKGELMHFTVLSDTHITPAHDPNLIGWWKADEPATAIGILDYSGNGLHAALEGNATWIEGKVAGAVELDGRSAFLTLKAPNTEVTEATLCAWIRPKDVCTENPGIIFWRGSQTSGLNLNQGNEVGYHWNDHQTTWSYRSGLVAPPDQWSFVAIVIEPNEARFYVNDLDAPAFNKVSHAPSAFDGPMYLGRDTYNINRRFNGALDDMRFYGKALSQEELAKVRDYGVKED
jgi:hypothetical protein